MNKKKYCILYILFFVIVSLNAYGVLAHPRKVFVIKTQYFEIIFPQEEAQTAHKVARTVDALYEEAQTNLGTNVVLKMPLIITPDSDEFSIEYTTYPYNRIIFYDAVPEKQVFAYDDIVKSVLYKEIYSALSKTKMSPANQFIRKFAGDNYTPVSLYNLPFAFVEGFSLAAEKISQEEAFQLLSQAKHDGTFPTWFQVASLRDVYPYSKVQYAAGAAFMAYLIQAYGIEKFDEFWLECGKLHPFFTAGIIKKVYGRTIEALWQAFVDSIPLPQIVELGNSTEQKTTTAQQPEAPAFLVQTSCGLVWYDKITHEVLIEDSERKKGSRRLFLAEEVGHISVSKDGNVVAVSLTEGKALSGFPANNVWLYDLQNNSIFRTGLALRDAALIDFGEKRAAIAGVGETLSKRPAIQVYSLCEKENSRSEKLEPQLAYERVFEKNQIPLTPVEYAQGCVLFVLADGTKPLVGLWNCIKNEESYFAFDEKEGVAKIWNLSVQKLQTQQIFTFNYLTDFSADPNGAFIRSGYLSQDLHKVCFQQCDVGGGVNSPVIKEDTLYYVSEGVWHNSLQKIEISAIDYADQALFKTELSEGLKEDETEFESQVLKKYLPFKYMFPISVVPFFAVRDIDYVKDVPLWPSLGFTLKTQADPLLNNSFTFSAGWLYAKLDFDWAVNTSTAISRYLQMGEQLSGKEKVLSLFYENTSTPVDIRGGTMFKFNMDGEYEFKAVFGTDWKASLPPAYADLHFNIGGTYKVSTDYYDENLAETFQSKSDWPAFSQAYGTVEIAAMGCFENLHQSGFSVYEQSGFSFGLKIYSFWDLYTISLLKDSDYYTPVQFDMLGEKRLADITQLNLGLLSTIAIPCLIPLKNSDGWIKTLPSTVSVELLNKAGTAMHFNVETLILGKEIHNGFSALYLYFNRVGVKLGYNFDLIYDTKTTPLSDLRKPETLKDAFANSSIQNSFYLRLNLDNVIAIGALSKAIINTDFRTTWYPQTNGILFSLEFNLNF